MGLLNWLKGLLTRSVPPAPRPAKPAPASPAEVVARKSPFPAGTGPARLVVMRHAEKSGDKRDPHLNLPGRKRAEALVGYIPATFGKPDFLIAARTSLKSRRPAETLEPLAAALSLEIRAKFDDGDIAPLIETLRSKKRFTGKMCVICWRHSQLPGLLVALGAAPGTFPKPWPDDDYATMLDITFPGDGTVKTRRVDMTS